MDASSGVPPESETQTMRTALLLLGVQHRLLENADTRIPDAPAVLGNIRRVLEAARTAAAAGADTNAKPRIVHVRHAGAASDPEEAGALLLHDGQADEIVIDKQRNNAFAEPALDRLIRPDVEVVIVGVTSEYAVKSTAKAAIERGNTVILIRGAHGTYDHTELNNHSHVNRGAKIAANVERELDKAGAMVLDMEFVPNLFEGR
ncbi:Isochorismatase domain-containing protein [Mycena indigotica]|uniref:Isochorismatase domain-containing protein n=1 Tax=Mycena indigotica TaxID=2126181 RepID=A0A8H6T7P3_9AGAR|nr:Isochorismatase domain-containing protein [Mycena indigotica]KAF7311726.1 Isochorismatase domain-containing protein [Mycena indigotica]